jgi:hypothetical protein
MHTTGKDPVHRTTRIQIRIQNIGRTYTYNDFIALVLSHYNLHIDIYTTPYRRRRLLAEGPAAHLSCSLVAGLAACLASNPLDVVRTRLMVQRR